MTAALQVQLRATRGAFRLAVGTDIPMAGTTVLCGPSGSGKTTTLRAIAGLEPGIGGTVAMRDGGDPEPLQDTGAGVHVPPHQRRMVLVFQQGELFPHLDVAGNLEFARSRAAAAARQGPAGGPSLAEVTDALDLGPLQSRSVHDLSGGERQRVALARALAYAHGQDVIHRDLKPSNLFYDAGGARALLSDFGLAKNLLDVPITAVGTKMMGTPNYMAPEQVEGEETTGRTDVYHAGLVLYELATGDRPFLAASPFLAIMQRCEQDVPLDEGPGSAIHPAWKALIRRACARFPEDRYPSAAEMLAELTASAAAPPQP